MLFLCTIFLTFTPLRLLESSKTLPYHCSLVLAIVLIDADSFCSHLVLVLL